ncbi:TniQ family protein [Burkholderia ubonensis]|uniref:TniQ family protein n=1 Tax=Burkholderia ubonensis TaxID=101571 RepID=UPI0009B317B5|nr:TniQ family protein [Burkholderia ubonensis]
MHLMNPVSNLLLFPASLADETIASRASRYHIITRNRTTRESFQQLFGKPRTALTDIVSPDLPALALRLPGDSRANLDQLLEENTLYPFVKLFGSWRVPDHWLGSVGKPVSIRRRTLGLVGKTKLCELCVRDDFESLGSPYVHRAHQVPGVAHCWRHRAVLLERCPHCGCPFERPRELLEVPWKPCVCGYRLGSQVPASFAVPTSSDAVHSYAVFVRDLLIAAPGAYSLSALVSACTQKLRELGLGRGQRGIDRQAATTVLEDYYGEEFLQRADPAYAAGKRGQWFRMSSKTGARDVPLGRQLLTAHFLFTDVSRFVLALDAAAADDGASRATSPATRDSVSAARNANDKVARAIDDLRRVIEENPRYTLEDLWARYRGTLARLLKWDARAFEQVKALVQKPRHLQHTSTRIVTPHPRDEEFADRLRQAALRLYASTDRPAKISKSTIGRAAKLAHIAYARSAYPRSTRVLEEFVESQWHFYARRYVWAFAHASTANVSASRLLEDAGVWYYKFIELDAYFRKRPLPPVGRLRDGQIVALLREYGIDLKWEGPCPDKSFMKSGRAYVKRGLQPIAAGSSAPQYDARSESINGPASDPVQSERKQA